MQMSAGDGIHVDFGTPHAPFAVPAPVIWPMKPSMIRSGDSLHCDTPHLQTRASQGFWRHESFSKVPGSAYACIRAPHCSGPAADACCVGDGAVKSKRPVQSGQTACERREIADADNSHAKQAAPTATPQMVLEDRFTETVRGKPRPDRAADKAGCQTAQE